jgi:hypothetical protein
MAGDIRHLKYLLKQAHKAMGKQGDTIYALRNEVAALRERLRRAEAEVEHYETVAKPAILLPMNREVIVFDGPTEDEADAVAKIEPSHVEGLA